MGSQKTLTNEKYMYNCKEFQIYKTKKGVRLIKINNSFVNINNVSSINSKINEKNINDMVTENINELTNLDICEVKTNGVTSVTGVTSVCEAVDVQSDNTDSTDSIDGEEYILL